MSVAVGDFNGDGKQDLATANFFSADTVSVLLGDGSGGFGTKTDITTGDGPFGVAVGDFNGDGKTDLATANFFADTASVLLGDGSGGFAVKTDFVTDHGPYSVASGDVNGDGQADLAVANYSESTTSVLLNDASHAAFTGKADGIWYFHVRAVDNVGAGGPVVIRAVRIDTRSPRTKAPYRATVRRGRIATLKYKVADPRPGSPTAGVTIRIKTLTGKTVKTLRFSGKSVNRLLSARFRCRLAKKTYRFFVYATDQAGNVQSTIGANRLVVN
jgi:hypothetical protein